MQPLNLLCRRGWPRTSDLYASTSLSWITGMCWDTCSKLRWRFTPSHILSKHSAKWAAGSASGPLLIFFILRITCILAETVLFHLIAVYRPWQWDGPWWLELFVTVPSHLCLPFCHHFSCVWEALSGSVHPFRWKAQLSELGRLETPTIYFPSCFHKLSH